MSIVVFGLLKILVCLFVSAQKPLETPQVNNSQDVLRENGKVNAVDHVPAGDGSKGGEVPMETESSDKKISGNSCDMSFANSVETH